MPTWADYESVLQLREAFTEMTGRGGMRQRGRSGLVITLAAVAALSAAFAVPAQAQASRAGDRASAWWPGRASVIRTALTTKAPYQPEGSVASYQPAPPGFQLVFTENFSRHGERTLTSSTEGDDLLTLWQIVAADGALTPLGRVSARRSSSWPDISFVMQGADGSDVSLTCARTTYWQTDAVRRVMPCSKSTMAASVPRS
jgi:hypothetical protein